MINHKVLIKGGAAAFHEGSPEVLLDDLSLKSLSSKSVALRGFTGGGDPVTSVFNKCWDRTWVVVVVGGGGAVGGGEGLRGSVNRCHFYVYFQKKSKIKNEDGIDSHALEGRA